MSCPSFHSLGQRKVQQELRGGQRGSRMEGMPRALYPGVASESTNSPVQRSPCRQGTLGVGSKNTVSSEWMGVGGTVRLVWATQRLGME